MDFKRYLQRTSIRRWPGEQHHSFLSDMDAKIGHVSAWRLGLAFGYCLFLQPGCPVSRYKDCSNPLSGDELWSYKYEVSGREVPPAHIKCFPLVLWCKMNEETTASVPWPLKPSGFLHWFRSQWTLCFLITTWSKLSLRLETAGEFLLRNQKALNEALLNICTFPASRWWQVLC